VSEVEKPQENVTESPFSRYKGKDINGETGTIYDEYSGEQDVLELVDKAKNGDVNAFGKIYNTYLDRIYRYVYYQVRDKAVAEDLTQEIFTKAWEALRKFKWKGKPFSSWLYRIAHNRTMDFFRAMKKDSRFINQTAVDDCDPVQEAEGKFMHEQLASAISQLNAQQREIIILKFIEGLNNHEIAQVVGKSQGAIRVTQMRALAVLRQNLTGEIY
jgi:RNA polymerase sigma-70 factor (ECF subfamily)